MTSRGNWLAAAVFFLAGCLALAVPPLFKAMLLQGLYAAASGFDHEMVEGQMPTFMYAVAGIAFVLAAAALALPRRAS